MVMVLSETNFSVYKDESTKKARSMPQNTSDPPETLRVVKLVELVIFQSGLGSFERIVYEI